MLYLGKQTHLERSGTVATSPEARRRELEVKLQRVQRERGANVAFGGVFLDAVLSAKPEEPSIRF